MRQKVKPSLFVRLCCIWLYQTSFQQPSALCRIFGLKAKQIFASTHETNENLSGRGVSLPLLQKRAGFACPFLLTEPAKSGFSLFAAFPI
ncbi:MAG: hypothetical protein LBC37_05070 [Zoogloeaceae bacterium]|nr:hypothetical protein [Zoogloeaceae bacterium]